jgi:hypothetical protein
MVRSRNLSSAEENHRNLETKLMVTFGLLEVMAVIANALNFRYEIDY